MHPILLQESYRRDNLSPRNVNFRNFVHLPYVCYACSVPVWSLAHHFFQLCFWNFRHNCHLYMAQWDRWTCPRAIMCDNSDNVLRFRHILDWVSLNSGPPKLATWPCISFILWELKQESMEYVCPICWGKAPRAQLLKKSAFLFCWQDSTYWTK